MPNPLAVPGPQRDTSTQTQHKEAYTPRTEAYEGDNNPYRGTEAHGVEPTEDPTNIPGWNSESIPVPVEIETPDPDPIPVRIVSGESAQEFKRWRVATEYASPEGRRIVNALDTRTILKVRNSSDAVTVFVGPDESVSAFTGYPLGPGQEITLTTTEDVWGIAAEQVLISVLYEYTVRG